VTNRTNGSPRDQLSLFADAEVIEAVQPVVPAADSDTQARTFAVDPSNNVVLEASAGTGKTSVLVARYINLLKAGVDPSNILAITFTRKAAAEMRERIITELRAAAGRSELDRARWVELRDRLSEIAISTIDAFCLSLLREFPLEADLDPGFGMADETEVPRLVDEALDRSLRILTGIARSASRERAKASRTFWIAGSSRAMRSSGSWPAALPISHRPSRARVPSRRCTTCCARCRAASPHSSPTALPRTRATSSSCAKSGGFGIWLVNPTRRFAASSTASPRTS
jgi:hypothetical protein